MNNVNNGVNTVFGEMQSMFKRSICNQFILHGNIMDYVKGGTKRYISLKDHLCEWMTKEDLNTVAIFDLASGLQFVEEYHETSFREATGLVKKKHQISDIEKKQMTSEHRKMLQDDHN